MGHPPKVGHNTRKDATFLARQRPEPHYLHYASVDESATQNERKDLTRYPEVKKKILGYNMISHHPIYYYCTGEASPYNRPNFNVFHK